MTSVGMNNNIAPQKLAQPLTPSQAIQKVPSGEGTTQTQQAEKNQVNISAQGKALLAASTKAEATEKQGKNEPSEIGDKVESFAYGALGMDHPEEAKEAKDGSYTAGQYLKGALTVGALLLAIV